jgi:N-acetylneuraminate synthase
MEVIAEIGINANGDIDIAKKLIDVASSAGCDYVKFQKRAVGLVYSDEELSKPRDSKWGTTTRQQKEGLEFGEDEYLEIDEYCRGKIKWFASPWDIVSMVFISQFDIPFIKVASAMLTNDELISAKSPSQKFILSTGGSTLEEIDHAVHVIGKDKIYCILHCTMTYPSKPEEQNLNCITALKERYPWAKIGFSNHYAGLEAMRRAAMLGAEMLEFHITLDRASEGSDQAASIEPRGVFELMAGLRLGQQMMGDGIKTVFESEKPILEKLRR